MRALFGRVRKKVGSTPAGGRGSDVDRPARIPGRRRPQQAYRHSHREDILAALPNHDRSAPVASFMRSPVESASLATPVEALLERLQSAMTRALFVTNSDGAIVGIVTGQTLAQVMMIKSARPDSRFDRRD
jgi:CBS-domain-containing membrane protein